jgi:phosphoglycerol transferase MdoB-like AlkP superfamily enzyme
MRFPVRLFLFWMSLFVLFRLWFVLWFQSEWNIENPRRIWSAFKHALPLDLSICGYLMTIPMVIWAVSLVFGVSTKQITNRINLLLISLVSLISLVNINLYKEWNTLLNQRALDYLKSPLAMIHSFSWWYITGFLVFYGILIRSIYGAYLYLVGVSYDVKIKNKKSLWFLLLIPLFLGVSIRGSLGVMPVNESAVYYSPHLFDNHAATNPTWHLIHCILEKRSKTNPYSWFSSEKAKELTNNLFNLNILESLRNDSISKSFLKDSSVNSNVFSLNQQKTNLVFIVMESMTANVVGAMGVESGLTPNLDTLINDGLLFQKCYGSGYRTDQGIVSILSGYPAQPDQSIILLEDKSAKLPSISAVLKDNGYENAFFYGAELTFANMGVYLRQQKFDKVFDVESFSNKEKTQRWGVDDNIVLQRAVKEMNQFKTPFFSAILTLSLHPPFDVPYKSKWSESKTDADQFRNSTLFADDAIGNFFRAAKKEKWFENTVFVLVADHGSVLPQKNRLDGQNSRHIPWIIYGKPLNYALKGLKIDNICNHHDLPKTILSLLNIETKVNFPWSRDLLNTIILKDSLNKTYGIVPSKQDINVTDFAYFTNENGIGWVTTKGSGFYTFEDNKWITFDNGLDSIQKTTAKGYLQHLYEDYLKK